MSLPPPTAEDEASFLLPYLKDDFKILDLGCGAGNITASLAKYVPKGWVVGLDVSATALEAALQKAKTCTVNGSTHTHTEEHDAHGIVIKCFRNNVPNGHGSIRLQKAQLLWGIPFPENTVDVVFASQFLGILRPAPHVLSLLKEALRVLKPGGLLATRDAMDTVFYPKTYNLNHLWSETNEKIDRARGNDPVAPLMPGLVRQAGFAEDRVRQRVGTMLVMEQAQRRGLAEKADAALKEGGLRRGRWLQAGVGEEVIEETRKAFGEWAGVDYAWMAALQMEVLAFK